MLLGLRRFQTVLIIGALVLTEKIAIMIVTTVVLTVLKHLPYQRIQIYVTNMTLQKKTVVSHHLTGQVFQTV
jgi:hypothetical protein